MDLLDGRLKFRHLILLIAVYEHGSVVRAAESLHLTQPAATRTLHELEALADLPLFVRVPRGMRPTVYGEALTEHARAVVAEIRRAGDHLTGLRQGLDGTVTVGTLLAGANVLLPRAVAGLKRERPRLTVVVREGTPDVLHPALLAGELDVIVGRVGSTPTEGDGLRQRKLYREPIRLAVRSGHPLLDTADVTLADTLGFPGSCPSSRPPCARNSVPSSPTGASRRPRTASSARPSSPCGRCCSRRTWWRSCPNWSCARTSTLPRSRSNSLRWGVRWAPPKQPTGHAPPLSKRCSTTSTRKRSCCARRSTGRRWLVSGDFHLFRPLIGRFSECWVAVQTGLSWRAMPAGRVGNADGAEGYVFLSHPRTSGLRGRVLLSSLLCAWAHSVRRGTPETCRSDVRIRVICPMPAGS